MQRRDFLITSLAAVSGAMLPACDRAAPPPKVAGFDPYESVTLGSSGITTSRLGMGTGSNAWQRASDQTRLGATQLHALVRAAYDRGIRLFDTADLYGSHQYLAAAMRELPRDTYTLTSKIWFRDDGLPEAARPDADLLVERFCHELKTDHIDILMLHCVTDGDWNTKLSDQMQRLDTLKRKGIIRALGVSCHSLPAMITAGDEPWVDIILARINAYGDQMDAPPGLVAPALDVCHAAGKGVIGMKLVGAGKYGDRLEKLSYSLKYVLGLRSVDAMVVGFQQPAHIDDIAVRIARVPFDTRRVPPIASDRSHEDDSWLSRRIGL